MFRGGFGSRGIDTLGVENSVFVREQLVDGADDRQIGGETEPDYPSTECFLQHVSYVWC